MLGDAVEIRVGCLREMLKHTPYFMNRAVVYD